MLPSTKINATTKLVPKNEIPIMKPTQPLGKLYYFEYSYRNILKERKEKIAKIKKRLL